MNNNNIDFEVERKKRIRRKYFEYLDKLIRRMGHKNLEHCIDDIHRRIEREEETEDEQ